MWRYLMLKIVRLANGLQDLSVKYNLTASSVPLKIILDYISKYVYNIIKQIEILRFTS